MMGSVTGQFLGSSGALEGLGRRNCSVMAWDLLVLLCACRELVNSPLSKSLHLLSLQWCPSPGSRLCPVVDVLEPKCSRSGRDPLCRLSLRFWDSLELALEGRKEGKKCFTPGPPSRGMGGVERATTIAQTACNALASSGLEMARGVEGLHPMFACPGQNTSAGPSNPHPSCGDAGYRSPYLSHAKRALYHVSYIPSVCLGRINNYKSLICHCQPARIQSQSAKKYFEAGYSDTTASPHPRSYPPSSRRPSWSTREHRPGQAAAAGRRPWTRCWAPRARANRGCLHVDKDIFSNIFLGSVALRSTPPPTPTPGSTPRSSSTSAWPYPWQHATRAVHAHRALW